jgi:hypothetical protein
VRELVRLRKNITALERSLSDGSADDPRYAGQRELLANEYNNRALLFELTEFASDLPALFMECRIQYMKAKAHHDQCSRRHANGGPPCEDWWESLGKMQYLSHLIASLEELKRHYSSQELQTELHAQTRGMDFTASTEHLSMLGAMARAEGVSVEQAHLVLDFIEAGGPEVNGQNGQNGSNGSKGRGVAPARMATAARTAAAGARDSNDAAGVTSPARAILPPEDVLPVNSVLVVLQVVVLVILVQLVFLFVVPIQIVLALQVNLVLVLS